MDNMAESEVKEAFYTYQWMKFANTLFNSKREAGAGFETYAVFDSYHIQLAKFSNLLCYYESTPIQEPDSANTSRIFRYFILDDYLSDKQLMELALCVSELYQDKQGRYNDFFYKDEKERSNILKEYMEYKLDFKTATNGEVTKLAELTITEVNWKKQDVADDESNYALISSDELYHWSNEQLNEDYIISTYSDHIYSPISVDFSISMPYLTYGLKEWRAWMSEEEQHKIDRPIYDSSEVIPIFRMDNYIRAISSSNEFSHKPKGFFEVSKYTSSGVFWGFDANNPNQEYTLYTYHTYYPYLYALDNLKFVYVFSFLFGILCAITLAFQLNKLYEKQLMIEKSRRQFTQAMAHELKTPMGIIRNYSEGLKEQIAEEKREHYLNTIIEETEHMDGLVLTMLELSRMDSDHFELALEEVSMIDIMNSVLDKFRLAFSEKDIYIAIDCKKDEIIYADRRRLTQVIDNLVSNALAYTPMHEKVNIQLTEIGFSIENTGIFIPEDKLVHLWDMFYRIDEQRDREDHHMGLGLYLVKRILEMHGMKYKVENSEYGVKFEVYYNRT
jgi:hypothetical protein